MIRTLVLLLLMAALFPAHAQIQRDPTGVNVAIDRPTSLLIRFAEQNGDLFTTEEALFCTELLANGACAPGTILGQLPAFADRGSTAVGQSQLTDFMTIPFSVTRLAVERARTGAFSDFFYVRRFSPVGGADIGAGPGQDVFVSVTCRLTGGTARSPLSLSYVEITGQEAAEASDSDTAIRFVRLSPANLETGRVEARIEHTGTGRLLGWWEVRGPGDPEIRPIDLFTEASLPASERVRQQRFQRVKRIDQQVYATGEIVLQGPRYSDLPQSTSGRYEILLRLDVSQDRETLSTLSIPGQPETVFAGAVAGFPLPTLEYMVPAALLGERPTRLNARLQDASDGRAILWTPPGTPGLVFELSLGQDDDEAGVDTVNRLIAPAEGGRAELPEGWQALDSGGFTARLLGADGRAFSATETVAPGPRPTDKANEVD